MRHHNHYLHCDAPPSSTSTDATSTGHSPPASHHSPEATVVASSLSSSSSLSSVVVVVEEIKLEMLHSSPTTDHHLQQRQQTEANGSQIVVSGEHEHILDSTQSSVRKLKRCLTNTSPPSVIVYQHQPLAAEDNFHQQDKRQHIDSLRNKQQSTLTTTNKRFCTKGSSKLDQTTIVKPRDDSNSQTNDHHHLIDCDRLQGGASIADRSILDSDTESELKHSNCDQLDRLDLSREHILTTSTTDTMTASVEITRIPLQTSTTDTVSTDIDSSDHHPRQTFHDQQDDDDVGQVDSTTESNNHLHDNSSHQIHHHRHRLNSMSFANSDRLNHHEACVAKLTQAQLDTLGTLFKIIRNGDYEEFAQMLDRKCFKSLLNVFIDGQTALHYSLLYGRNLAWCKELVRNGANPNLTNRAGWHPIHLAAFNGSRDTMRYLIERIAS